MSFYCKGDNMYHYEDEIPKSLRKYFNHIFESSSEKTEEFMAFDRAFKNYIKKVLPEGYKIHKWSRNHFESSWVIKTPNGKFIYSHISDVRYWIDEWATNILCRTMSHEKDWTGGTNNFACLFNYGEKIKEIAERI